MDFASVLEAGGSLALSIGVFAFAVWLNRKTNSPLLNPLLVTVAIIMIALTVFNIPLESYEKGATLISSMLGPATAVLAFSIYQQRKILQSNFLPIFVGCLVGSIVSMVSAYGLCELFGLGDAEVSTPILLNEESVKELLAIRSKAKFNEQLEAMVKTDAEKRMLVELAFSAGAEDAESWKVDALRKLAETAKV